MKSALTYQADIDAIRTKIAAVQEKIEVSLVDRLTRAEAADRISQWVDDQAASVDVGGIVDEFCRRGRPNDRWGHFTAIVEEGGHSFTGQFGAAEIAPYICWMGPEAVKAKLIAALDEHADNICCPDDKAHARKDHAALKDELLKLEREEERVISEAEIAGFNVSRRPDARPEIILEVQS